MKMRPLSFPITIRPGSADATTIINTVIRQEYCNTSLTDHPVWMLDAGAHIGDTAAFFLSRYPCLKIVALEPNAESFNNCRP